MLERQILHTIVKSDALNCFIAMGEVMKHLTEDIANKANYAYYCAKSANVISSKHLN